jgi:hypothetical protein
VGWRREILNIGNVGHGHRGKNVKQEIRMESNKQGKK